MLETPRLVIRRFRAQDAEALAAYRSDPQVARYQGWTPPLPLDAAVDLVCEFAAGSPDRPGWFQYAVVLKDSGRLIGDIGVCLHENLMQADLGFTLAAAHQSRGYATEAVRAVLTDLFEHRGLHRVSAECDARNLRSAALLRRLGFLGEGHRREATWLKGEWTDDLLFGMTASGWAPPDGTERP